MQNTTPVFARIGHRLVIVTLIAVTSAVTPGFVFGETRESPDEAIAVKRFLDILERNPREGMPLDRVYRFYSGNHLLETLMKRYASEAAQNPNDYKKRLLLGLLLEKSGNRNDALAEYRHAAKIAPDDFHVRYYLGRSLWKQDLLTDAAESLERAVEVAPPSVTDHVETVLLLGKVYAKLGDMQKFDLLLERAEKSFPDDDTVLLNLVKTLETEKRDKEAVERYSQILERLDLGDMAYMRCLLARADAEMKLGHNNEAIADCEYVLDRLHPDNPLTEKVFDRVEKAFRSEKEINRLTEFYERRLNVSTNRPAVTVRYADALLGSNHADKAEEIIAQAAEKSPSDMDLRLQWIKILVRQKNFDAAERQFDVLETLFPDHPEHIILRGEIALQNTNLTDEERKNHAGNIWRKMLQRDPDDIATMILLAQLFDVAGMPEETEKLFQQAAAHREKNPDYRDYLETAVHFETLIRLYNKPGNEAAAVEFYVRSLLKQPDIAQQPDLLDRMFGPENGARRRDVELLSDTVTRLSRHPGGQAIAQSLESRLDEAEHSLPYLLQMAEHFLHAGDIEKARSVLENMTNLIPQDAETMLEYASLLEKANLDRLSVTWKNAAYRLEPQRLFRDLGRVAHEYEQQDAVDQLVDLILRMDDAILLQHTDQLSRLVDVMTGKPDRRKGGVRFFDALWNLPVRDERQRLKYKTDLLTGLIWNVCRETVPYYREIILELIAPTNDVRLTEDSDELHNPHWIVAWSSEQCRSLSSVLPAVLPENDIKMFLQDVERMIEQHESVDALQRDWTRYTYAIVMKALIDLELGNPEAAFVSLRNLERHEQTIMPLICCDAALGREFAKFPEEKYRRYAISCFQKYRQINRHSYGEVYIALQLAQLQASLKIPDCFLF